MSNLMPRYRDSVPVLEIGDRRCGPHHPTLFIAEEGQANDGDFPLAVEMIAVAADCGADGIEFQLAVASDLYVAHHSGYTVYKPREFSPTQIEQLIAETHVRTLLFHAACLSERLVDTTAGLGADCLVVNAMDLNNPHMLDAVAASGKPFLLATLMATLDEIDWAVARVRARGAARFGLLHGQHIMSSQHGQSVPVEYVQLDCIMMLERRCGVPVGFVDHTNSEIMPALAASRGAPLVTKHLAPRPGWRGPDWQVCLEPEAWRRACANLRYADAARGDDKTLSVGEVADRSLHRRSIVAARDVPAGKRLEPSDLVFKRPGGGLDPADVEQYLGRRTRIAVKADEIITIAALEP